MSPAIQTDREFIQGVEDGTVNVILSTVFRF